MPYYRRSSRRSFGALRRASQSGKRRMTVMIPTADAFQMVVGAGNQWTNLAGSCPYFRYSGNNISKASLIESVLYRTYAGLYDQVKIDGVSVKISIMTNIGQGGVVPALKLVTMWDRDARKTEIVDGQGLPNTGTLQTGSESQTTLVVNNSKAIIYRSCRASDLQERTTFHDSSFEVYSTTGFIDTVWKDGGQAGFCPALFFAMQTANAPGTGSSYTFDVAMELKWYVTFRNPKFGLAAASSKMDSFTDLKTVAIADVKEDVEEKEEEAPVLKKKKVVYEEELIPDDENEEDDEESQEPMTQQFKSPMKKAGKKSS